MGSLQSNLKYVHWATHEPFVGCFHQHWHPADLLWISKKIYNVSSVLSQTINNEIEQHVYLALIMLDNILSSCERSENLAILYTRFSREKNLPERWGHVWEWIHMLLCSERVTSNSMPLETQWLGRESTKSCLSIISIDFAWVHVCTKSDIGMPLASLRRRQRQMR